MRILTINCRNSTSKFEFFEAAIARATDYSTEHFEDPPEISKWTWTP